MREKGATIGTLYGEFRAQQDATRGKLNAIDRIAAEALIDATQDKIAGLKDRSNAARDMISQIGGLVSNILGFSGWYQEAGWSGDSRAGAGNIFTGVMMIAFDLVNREENKRLEKQIKGLETELKGLKTEKHDRALMEAWDELNKERQLLRLAANKVVNAQGQLEQAQHEYRLSMSDMGSAADQSGRKGGDRFEVLAQLLSEADAFDAQAHVVGDVGRQYLHDYGAESGTQPGHTVRHWRLQVYKKTKLCLVGPKQQTDTWVSTWRQAQAASNIRMAVKEFEGQRNEVAALGAELREVFESRAKPAKPAAGSGGAR